MFTGAAAEPVPHPASGSAIIEVCRQSHSQTPSSPHSGLSHKAWLPLSGQMIWPQGPEQTESVVPSRRCTKITRGTNFPPEGIYRDAIQPQITVLTVGAGEVHVHH